MVTSRPLSEASFSEQVLRPAHLAEVGSPLAQPPSLLGSPWARIRSGLSGNALNPSDSQLPGEAGLFTRHAQGDLARSASCRVIGLFHVTGDVQPGDWLAHVM